MSPRHIPMIEAWSLGNVLAGSLGPSLTRVGKDPRRLIALHAPMIDRCFITSRALLPEVLGFTTNNREIGESEKKRRREEEID
ncbi:hypothetical protein VNO80_17232 [Phaseolus coccineus]|uniref:Uncharacterized protein n=1 Tax=Phaseolus coccineus TaxID=3886 RepID=A0AAN9R0U8_PHACN